MLSLFCGNRYPLPFSGSPLPLAQFAELFSIKRFRSTNNRSDSEPFFIGITSERLSTSRRNRYRHQIGIPIAIARNPHLFKVRACRPYGGAPVTSLTNLLY